MKINIAQIRQAIGARQSFSFHTPVAAIAESGEAMWLTGQADISGEVVNNGRLLHLSGCIQANARQECNRCLAEFTATVAIPFSEDYQEGATDPDILPLTGDEIDIAEIVREALVIGEPLKAVCTHTCKGLCPKCGANLNAGPCGCDLTSIDPRLAALEKLLERK